MKERFWPVRAMWRLLYPQRILLIGIIFVTFLMTLGEGASIGVVYAFLGQSVRRLTLPIPLLGRMQNILAGFPFTTQVVVVAGFLVLMTAYHSVCAFLSNYWSSLSRIRIEQFLRDTVFEQFHNVQLAYVERQKLGAWMPLLTQYNSQTSNLMLSVVQAFGNLVILLFYLLILLYVNGWITLVISVFLLFPVLIMRPILTRRIRKASRQFHILTRELFAIVQENLTALKLIHLFHRRDWSLNRFRQTLRAWTQANLHTQMLLSINRPVLDFITMTALAGVFIISALTWQGTTQAWQSQIALFLVISLRLAGPIADIGTLQAQYTQNAPAFQAVMEFIDPAGKPFIKNGDVHFPGLRKGVEFRNVSFQYPGEHSFALRNISLSIPRGKYTAVVGMSGAGKTTMVNLITRLYDCTEGSILVDGTDLRDLEIGSWLQKVAVVHQDAFLFHESAAENIRFARLDASDDDVVRVAKISQAHDFLMSFPDGYQTELRDRGIRLSGGQQQRIALARAFLVDADLMILDEATSELDSRTEMVIQQALEEYRRDRTVFAIAHRLSTIRQADQILVLEDGKLVEQGTHEELMRQHGAYWRLAEAQSLLGERKSG